MALIAASSIRPNLRRSTRLQRARALHLLAGPLPLRARPPTDLQLLFAKRHRHTAARLSSVRRHLNVQAVDSAPELHHILMLLRHPQPPRVR